jgi:cyclopropane fatty-acyl-phospholipid synthase-like methyltransferase
VHGLTLSEEQLAYCNNMATTKGLAHLMTFELVHKETLKGNVGLLFFFFCK